MEERAPRRHNTGEEIARLGVSEARSRRRGVVAVLGGVATVALATAAIWALSRREPPAPPPPAPEEAPQLQAATPAAAEPVAPAQPSARSSPLSLAPRARVKMPPSLAPAALPRPAAVAVPLTPSEKIAAEDLARELVAQKKGAVQLCFEHELKRDPSLTDNVTVTLDLKAPHRVARVSVQDEVRDRKLTRCIDRAMRSLQLPELASDLSVELPFALRGRD